MEINNDDMPIQEVSIQALGLSTRAKSVMWRIESVLEREVRTSTDLFEVFEKKGVIWFSQRRTIGEKTMLEILGVLSELGYPTDKLDGIREWNDARERIKASAEERQRIIKAFAAAPDQSDGQTEPTEVRYSDMRLASKTRTVFRLNPELTFRTSTDLFEYVKEKGVNGILYLKRAGTSTLYDVLRALTDLGYPIDSIKSVLEWKKQTAEKS